MPAPTSSSGGWVWLGSSLLLAILWANVAWLFREPRPGPIGRSIARLVTWPLAPWLHQVLRLLYYVGLPFTALVWGHALSERHLGLTAGSADTWTDWAQDLGWTAALGAGGWMLLALGWWAYRRALSAAGEESGVAGANSSRWILLREAAYHEVHWAFYRSALISELGQRSGDEYWGVWAGLACVALEAILNPAWRSRMGNPETTPGQLVRGALAIISAVLFLKTQNLWLALALHWAATWGLVTLMRGLPPLPAHTPDGVSA